LRSVSLTEPLHGRVRTISGEPARSLLTLRRVFVVSLLALAAGAAAVFGAGGWNE
jgi:hypothetical protein